MYATLYQYVTGERVSVWLATRAKKSRRGRCDEQPTTTGQLPGTMSLREKTLPLCYRTARNRLTGVQWCDVTDVYTDTAFVVSAPAQQTIDQLAVCHVD